MKRVIEGIVKTMCLEPDFVEFLLEVPSGGLISVEMNPSVFHHSKFVRMTYMGKKVRIMFNDGFFNRTYPAIDDIQLLGGNCFGHNTNVMK